jgi:hypothetical protein
MQENVEGGAMGVPMLDPMDPQTPLSTHIRFSLKQRLAEAAAENGISQREALEIAIRAQWGSEAQTS